jgi:hypothetical protein
LLILPGALLGELWGWICSFKFLGFASQLFFFFFFEKEGKKFAFKNQSLGYCMLFVVAAVCWAWWVTRND